MNRYAHEKNDLTKRIHQLLYVKTNWSLTLYMPKIFSSGFDLRANGVETPRQ